MRFKITPQEQHGGPSERLEFAKLIQRLNLAGYASKLLHYSDGSVLMEKMKQEDLNITNRINKHDPPSS